MHNDIYETFNKMAMTKIILNGVELHVEPGSTIMNACEQQGIEVPHFCYHEKLSIAGCCRMCLVEVEKNPKPVASCAWPVSEGMVIHTDSDKVKKARENVLELLLINHPLDCPVCDQAGECDLQDITLGYAKGEGEYDFNRRIVKNKNMGPLVKTVMTRCIHCTRCVRFMEEIAGAPEIGALNRGENMEITTYLEDNLHSELSGNLIDICPVGALTNKPNAFHARSWEYKKTQSIDVLDGVGSAIQIDSRDNEVFRILPLENDDINECWISDKTRFSYDGLLNQRLDTPYIRQNGSLIPASWDEAFSYIYNKLKNVEGKEFGALAGGLCDVEAIYMLNQFMEAIGSDYKDARPLNFKGRTYNRTDYLFNTSITGIEEADCILMIGCNPRIEAAMINARIRKRYLKGNVEIATLGAPTNVNYPVIDLGNSIKTLNDILEKKHPFSNTWFNAKKPMVILGYSSLFRRDSTKIQYLAQNLCAVANAFDATWCGYNILHTTAGIVGALDIGFYSKNYDAAAILDSCKNGTLKALYLMNVDDYDRTDFGDAFVIYQGHHGDKGAQNADVILPGVAYTEKTALYTNTEGRVQSTQKAVDAPGLAKEDWRIIKALADRLSVKIDIHDHETLRNRIKVIHPAYATLGQFIKDTPKITPLKSLDSLSNVPFTPYIKNFYMTDVITHHSMIMADCTKAQ